MGLEFCDDGGRGRQGEFRVTLSFSGGVGVEPDTN
jgi:hypothetical protein